MDAKGRLFIIVGPSGVGKTTLADQLRNRHPEWVSVPSVTTRPMRDGDVFERPYRYVSDADFDQLITQGEISDWCTFAGNRYGVMIPPIRDALAQGRICFKENEIYEWHALKEKYPDLAYAIRTIFLLPPSVESLADRIRNRSSLPEGQFTLRMESVRLEMETAHLADLQVVSEEGQQEKVYETVQRYILSELQPNRS